MDVTKETFPRFSVDQRAYIILSKGGVLDTDWDAYDRVLEVRVKERILDSTMVIGPEEQRIIEKEEKLRLVILHDPDLVGRVITLPISAVYESVDEFMEIVTKDLPEMKELDE